MALVRNRTAADVRPRIDKNLQRGLVSRPAALSNTVLIGALILGTLAWFAIMLWIAALP